MFKLVAFEPKHLSLFQHMPAEMRMGDAVDLSKLKGPAYTMFKDDDAVGSAGVDLYWQGVGEAWVIIGPLFYKYKFTCHKTIVEMLEMLEKKYNLHRIQATCLDGFEKAAKWLRHLGFENEGPLRFYGPGGEHFHRYARYNWRNI